MPHGLIALVMLVIWWAFKYAFIGTWLLVRHVLIPGTIFLAVILTVAGQSLTEWVRSRMSRTRLD